MQPDCGHMAVSRALLICGRSTIDLRAGRLAVWSDREAGSAPWIDYLLAAGVGRGQPLSSGFDGSAVICRSAQWW